MADDQEWKPPDSDADWKPPDADVQGPWKPPESVAVGWKPPSTDIPFSVTPSATPGAADPSKKNVKLTETESPLADWKSWLPAGGATAAELGAGALLGGPPGLVAGALIAAGGAGAGSLLKSGLEGTPVSEALPTAGWDAATQGAVPSVLGRATGAVLGKIFDPQRMYKNALRATGLTEETDKAVRAGLEGKIQLGWDMAGARAKNQARQAAFDSEIENLINSTPGNLSPQQYVASVQNGLDKVRGEWMQDPIEGAEFLDQVDDAEKRFLITHGRVQPIQRQITNKATGQTSVVTIQPQEMTLAELRANAQPISLTKAQGMKQQAYRTTRANQKTVQTAWSDLYQSGLGVEERNAIASALREDLENYPGLEKLKDLNRQSGDSQALNKALETFARRRLPTLGTLGTAIGGGVGGLMLGHSPGTTAAGAAVGLVKHALEDPLIQSRLAIALYGVPPAARTAAGTLGRAAIRAPIAAGKILIDADKAKQGPQGQPWQPPPQFAGGGLALEERMRRNTLESLRGKTS